ncbi:hypothetical protein POF50_006410 [Streptomyces sp. SL13]|uniref:Uncharacterized protein n=1 Tax=Streptantibioticus silvisoli TaxID=2705255 RepID=A0AA90GW74_9ACTN|nr:hypothetical protein [Streptantibioticus silvisoli]MDI5966229.1 hypothetical protein [Streptantibioticus silvisoli]MDI5968979.1 hypothetical protein [Streptantibioticus silvisoli]
MGRHRRAKLALGARSTVVKAAAAMGVATALAAGINSAANGPVGTQAAADTTGDPVNLAGNSSSEGGHHTATTSGHESVPTGFATESAGQPKLIQPASDVHAVKSTAAHTAQTATQTAPGTTATQAPAPVTSTAPTPPPTAPSDPGSAPPPASSAPAPAQGGSSGSGSTGPVGSLLGGVVGTVGGVVDGLLG